MRILLVAATLPEVEEVTAWSAQNRHHELRVLITGPGIVATTWNMAKLFHERQQAFDLAINAGIAGSFDPGFEKGTVAQVSTDIFADFGAQSGPDYLTAASIGLLSPDEWPFNKGVLTASHKIDRSLLPYPEARGITVNTVSGNQETISLRQALFDAQTESMEGAAFFYCCLQQRIPCLQLRSVSNPVEIRNRQNWNIPLAVTSLNSALIQLFKQL